MPSALLAASRQCPGKMRPGLPLFALLILLPSYTAFAAATGDTSAPEVKVQVQPAPSVWDIFEQAQQDAQSRRNDDKVITGHEAGAEADAPSRSGDPAGNGEGDIRGSVSLPGLPDIPGKLPGSPSRSGDPSGNGEGDIRGTVSLPGLPDIPGKLPGPPSPSGIPGIPGIPGKLPGSPSPAGIPTPSRPGQNGQSDHQNDGDGWYQASDKTASETQPGPYDAPYGDPQGVPHGSPQGQVDGKGKDERSADDPFEEALGTFDRKILEEREAMRNRRSPADDGLEDIPDASNMPKSAADSGRSLPTPRRPAPPMPRSRRPAQPDSSRSGEPQVAQTDAIPEDIPSGEDDDIIARQLREAAMSESDPVLRERLWDEYRRYKAK